MADEAVLPKFSVVATSDQRGTPRTTVSLPVFIESGERQHSARLHNLSHRGAMIEASVPLEPGGRIRFNCGTIATDAIVIWQRASRVGVRFVDIVEVSDVAHQITRSHAAASRRERRKQEIANEDVGFAGLIQRSARG